MKLRERNGNLPIACLLLLLIFATSVGAQGGPEQGKALYMDNCSGCHGAKGAGNGPDAATMPAKPPNFNDSKFWQGDAATRIRNAIQNGKGAMPSVDLKPAEINEVVDYMTKAFGQKGPVK